MLENVTLNPITTLNGRRVEVLQCADIERLADALLREAVATARAADIDIRDADIRECGG
jgi:ketopantoate reductase